MFIDLFGSVVNPTSIPAVGFSSVVKVSAKKDSNRKAIQKHSRKANRVVNKGSKAPKALSAEVKALRKAARVTKASNKQAKKAALLVKVDAPKIRVKPEAPKLKVVNAVFQRAKVVKPVLNVRKKEVVKVEALPSIVAALDKPHKSYVGNHRTCVGKKFPTKPRDRNRKPKGSIKGKRQKCSIFNFAVEISSEATTLHKVAESVGYKVYYTHYNGGALGSVDHDKKEIWINTMDGTHHAYVLAHELVHVAVELGLVTLDFEYSDVLDSTQMDLGAEYLKSCIDSYDEADQDEEVLAGFLMWNPEFVLALLSTPSGLPNNAFTSKAPQQGVKASSFAMTNHEETTLNSSDLELVTKAKELIELYVTIKGKDERKATALDALSYAAGISFLTEEDLMWCGINPVDKEDKSWSESLTHEKLINTTKAIVAFAELGLNIFPADYFSKFEQVCVVDGLFENALQRKAIFTWCANNNVPVYAATFSFKDGLKGQKKTLKFLDDTYELPEFVYNIETLMKLNVLYLSSNSEFSQTVNLATLNAIRLVNVLEPASTTQLVNFLYYFSNFNKVKANVLELSPHYTELTYGQVVFDFAQMTITANREHQVRAGGFMHGYGQVKPQTMMALLAIDIVGLNAKTWGQTYLDGRIAFLTQLWEEQDHYGQTMDNSQQLRVIRANTLSILGVKESPMGYPFFNLENSNTPQGVQAVAEYMIQHCIPFFVDKNAMKRVVIGAGVTALYAAMDFTKMIFKTILDTKKPGKCFTRAWQTLCIAADQGVADYQKYAKAYIQGNLVLRHIHQDGTVENIGIKGQSELTITGDVNFLINGSGVGYTWRSWSASCFKTVRDSFNAINLRKGETLDAVKAELEAELAKLLDTNKLHSTKNSKGGVVLLKFRGKRMLVYGGLNQDFLVSKEHGCEFKVTQVGTSNTLSIQLTVLYLFTNKEPKARGLGIKAVLKNAKRSGAKIYRGGKEKKSVSVLLGAETLKGNAARLQQYAEWVRQVMGDVPEAEVALLGGHTELAMEAIETPELVKVNGKWVFSGNRVVQNMNDMVNQFYAWWKENTKSYQLRDRMATEPFVWLLFGRAEMQGQEVTDATVAAALAHPANVKLQLINVVTGAHTNALSEASKGGMVYLEETFDGICAPYVYQIELASSRECSVEGQAPTIQQTAAVYAANPAMGEAVADTGIEGEDGVLGLAAMAMTNPFLHKVLGHESLSKVAAKEAVKTLTAENLVSLNESLFNMGINSMYPVNQDPYLAFYDAGVGKKFKATCLVNSVGLVSPLTEKDGDFSLMQALVGSARNYQINVGSGYNMGSVAACMSALKRYEFLTASKKGDKVVTTHALKELQLWAWVNALAWKTTYENSWLASYNALGEELSSILNDAASGIIEGRTELQTILAISSILHKVEGLPFSEEDYANNPIKNAWVRKLLWSYRIARAVGSIERYGKVAKGLALTEDDMPYIAICGAVRRCDQGRFANNEEVLNYLNAGEEGSGESIWTILDDMWGSVQHIMPFWMRRKLFKAKEVQLGLMFTTKSISKKNDPGSIYKNIDQRVEELIETVTDNYGQASAYMLSGLSMEQLENNLQIPVIDFEYAAMDMDPENFFGLVCEGSTWAYRSYKELLGAFRYVKLHCPLKKENGQFVEDDSVAPIRVVRGKKYWVDTLTPKEMMQDAALRYPNGVMIRSGDSDKDLELFIDFKAILKCGAFSSSGAATGFALNLANFMVAISSKFADRPTTFNSRGRNLLAGLQGQLREMMKKGTLRRIGRAASIKQGSKVMTSHSVPFYQVGAKTLPIFVMNPDDEIVKAGGYKLGSFASISRTPMIAKAYGIVLFSKHVDIGHIELDGMIFGLSNRGDGKLHCRFLK